jgi:endonuclease/exonuclease/phosphatase family metal-dependent hydrolase
MRCSIFGLVVGLALSACGGLEPGEELSRGASGKADDPGSPVQPALSLLTFNAGLARGAVALAEQRRPHIIDALRQTTADVVCMQEVWTDDDAGAIQDALRGTYPYFFRKKTEDTSNKSVPCGAWSTYKLNSCVKKQCTPLGISAEECVSNACADEYDALDDSCKLCLAANTDSPIWCALWPGAREYAWEGRNGLLLLSRYPIENPSYTPFDTVLVKRGVITATINKTTVQCTHLSSDLKTVPYPQDRRLRSWVEEQQEQVEILRAATDPQRCSVLMGDLNTGPSTAYITAEAFPTWQQLTQTAGFEEPWDSRVCTWCADNPLGSGTTYQLDHIMLNNCPAFRPRYTRVLNQPLQVAAEGDMLETRLSDHYGLLAELIPELPPVQ